MEGESKKRKREELFIVIRDNILSNKKEILDISKRLKTNQSSKDINKLSKKIEDVASNNNDYIIPKLLDLQSNIEFLQTGYDRISKKISTINSQHKKIIEENESKINKLEEENKTLRNLIEENSTEFDNKLYNLEIILSNLSKALNNKEQNDYSKLIELFPTSK